MKFGVLQFFSWPQRRVPIETVYERAFERIRIMDGAGYDAVWLAEHHFSSFSVCPSIHLMGTHVAAMTQRLRIGTGVSLAPFYDPLRLAEEVALLDVLSGGRVNWGVGRGYQKGEFAAFGVDPEKSYEIFREKVQVVLAAWTSDRLEFSGDLYSYDGIEVLPKPLQKPHPPVWLAASSPEALAWAGGAGYSIMLDPHSSPQRIGEKLALYREELRGAGHDGRGRDLPVARLLAIAPTRREAEEVARAGAEWTVSSHAKKGLQPAEVATERNRARKDMALGSFFTGRGGSDPIARYMDEVIIWGTPDEVADELRRLEESIGLSYLLAAPLSHQSFMLLTDEVMPAVA